MTLWRVGNKLATVNGKKINMNLPPVLIGEHYYGVVKIGNRYWTTENLYEPIGSFAGTGNATNCTSCWADFTNRDNSKGLGILYHTAEIINNPSSAARTQLNTMLAGTGFRLPTYNDFEDLLIASSDWHDYMVIDADGNDSLGFHGKNSGTSAYNWDYVIIQSRTYSLQVLCDNTTYNTFVFTHSNSQYWMVHFSNNAAYRFAIRLCADA